MSATHGVDAIATLMQGTQDQPIFSQLSDRVRRTGVPHAHPTADFSRLGDQRTHGEEVFPIRTGLQFQHVGGRLDRHQRFDVAVERVHRTTVVVVQKLAVLGQGPTVVVLEVHQRTRWRRVPFRGAWFWSDGDGAGVRSKLPRLGVVASRQERQRAFAGELFSTPTASIFATIYPFTFTEGIYGVTGGACNAIVTFIPLVKTTPVIFLCDQIKIAGRDVGSPHLFGAT